MSISKYKPYIIVAGSLIFIYLLIKNKPNSITAASMSQADKYTLFSQAKSGSEDAKKKIEGSGLGSEFATWLAYS